MAWPACDAPRGRAPRFVAIAAKGAVACALAATLAATGTARADVASPCAPTALARSLADEAPAASESSAPLSPAPTATRLFTDAARPAALDDESSFLSLTSHAPTCAEFEVTPAVIDCNSPRDSIYVGQMIGSCAAPRRDEAGARALSHRGDRRGPVCDLLGCNLAADPLHRGARTVSDERPLALSSLPRPLAVAVGAIATPPSPRPNEPPGARLERPPRPLRLV